MKRKILFVLFLSLITITVCFGYTPTLEELAFLANDCYTNYNRQQEVGYGFWVEYWSTGTSGFYGAAYTKNDLIVIAFRGTDDSNDLRADQGIILNSDSNLFRFLSYIFRVFDTRAAQAVLDQQVWDAIDFFVEAVDRENVMIVGHSLGGYLAQIVGWVYDTPTYTFNAPGASVYSPGGIEPINATSNRIFNYIADQGLNFIPRGTHIGERRNISGFTHSMDDVYTTIVQSTTTAVPVQTISLQRGIYKASVHPDFFYRVFPNYTYNAQRHTYIPKEGSYVFESNINNEIVCIKVGQIRGNENHYNVVWVAPNIVNIDQMGNEYDVRVGDFGIGNIINSTSWDNYDGISLVWQRDIQ